MQSLNRTKRSASRSPRKTHMVCLLISSFKTSFRFNRQYHSLPTSALCRFGRLNSSEENFPADFFKTFTCAALSTDSFNENSNYRNSKNAKQEPCFNFLCQVGFYQAYTCVREGRAIISRETEQI